MQMQMPVMDGLVATCTSKLRWPDVNVIMLTIYGPRHRPALEAGADAFVVKGGDPERLVSMLETVKMQDDR